MRIGGIIIFHLSKLWKAKFFILCDVIFLVRLQGGFDIDHSWEWKSLVIHRVQRNKGSCKIYTWWRGSIYLHGLFCRSDRKTTITSQTRSSPPAAKLYTFGNVDTNRLGFVLFQTFCSISLSQAILFMRISSVCRRIDPRVTLRGDCKRNEAKLQFPPG